MAQTALDTSGLPHLDNPGRIAILKSKWYPELVNSLGDTCERILRENGIERIETHTVPGTLELPLAAEDLLATDSAGDLDAVEKQIVWCADNRDSFAEMGPRARTLAESTYDRQVVIGMFRDFLNTLGD